MGAYKQIYDNIPITHPKDHVMVFQCCDCGLVHDIVFEDTEGDSIRMRIATNKRRTRGVRAAKTRQSVDKKGNLWYNKKGG